MELGYIILVHVSSLIVFIVYTFIYMCQHLNLSSCSFFWVQQTFFQQRVSSKKCVPSLNATSVIITQKNCIYQSLAIT